MSRVRERETHSGTVDLRDQEIIDKGRVKEAGREKYVGFRAPKAGRLEGVRDDTDRMSSRHVWSSY
jgi:predicted SPOUT superfamily RNA methylase MTH1